MKVFNPSEVAPRLPFRARLLAQMVGLDLALMRIARPQTRAPFRQNLRASIRALRNELRTAQ